MTIIEALKSGKPCTRTGRGWTTQSMLDTELFATVDILSDDWEVKEEEQPSIHTDNTEVIQKAEAWIARLEKQCEMYSKNVNGLQKHLEEAREERDKYKTAMDELRKSHDEEMRKAFEAGQRMNRVRITENRANDYTVHIEQTQSYEEWKKGGAK